MTKRIGFKRRSAMIGVCLLGAAALAAPAQGAKVTKTAAGGPLPDAPPVAPPLFRVGPPFVQEFTLGGKKVKGKQVLDVNLTINTFGSTAGAFNDLAFKLTAPNGFSETMFGDFGTSAVSATYDSESEVFFCNPTVFQSHDCNYSSGATTEGGGTFTGTAGDQDLALFKGLNPKGRWKLTWTDQDDSATSLIGTTTLEVKTGKKFAKD